MIYEASRWLASIASPKFHYSNRHKLRDQQGFWAELSARVAIDSTVSCMFLSLVKWLSSLSITSDMQQSQHASISRVLNRLGSG